LRLDTLSPRKEVKYYKIGLRVLDSAQASDSFACIGVGTAKGGNSKTHAFGAI